MVACLSQQYAGVSHGGPVQTTVCAATLRQVVDRTGSHSVTVY